MAKREDAEYIAFDPYTDECEVKCKTVKIVTTRAEHRCYCSLSAEGHVMPKGTRARFEKARIDGEFGQYYTCLACIDGWLDQVAGIGGIYGLCGVCVGHAESRA